MRGVDRKLKAIDDGDVEVRNMSLQAVQEARLREIVRQAVKDALEEEFMKLRLAMAPYISSEEQKEIEALYKAPSKRSVQTLTLNE